MSKNNTTAAQYRKLARAAEEDLDFKSAAYYYRKAIEVYPSVIGPIAKEDIKRLTEAMKSCEYMARGE